jgi:ABC-type transport system involved in multi-copper enzyme maturation permease subunit
MNVLPVIARELRVQARQPFTYNLRLLGVAALLAVIAFVALGPEPLLGEGGSVFSRLHLALFCAIWVLVPLSAADCISRERREDTLGLLLLTPLKARDIVFAKGLAHGLRAFTLWLAALPVAVIPLLLGGLGWQSVVLSCAVNFSSIALALGGSVLASSLCRQWHRSLTLTMVLAVFLVTAFAVVLSVSVVFAVVPYIPEFRWERMWQHLPSLAEIVVGGYSLVSVPHEELTEALSRLSLPAQRQAMIAVGLVTALSLLAACGMMLLAAWIVRRRWQHQGPSARVEKLERVFCTPILLRGLLRRWMRRKLERNPIGWLEQRTWSGRLVMWSWLAVLVAFYSTVGGSGGIYLRNFQALQGALAWMLMVNVAATAAGSFRRERESGVLELLLVAPLNSWQIISGRLRGIWAQFAPTLALLWGVWLFFATFERDVSAWAGAWVLVAFVTLPVIGLYYSLAKTHFLSAFVWTLLVGCLFPMLLVNIGVIQNVLLWQLGIPAQSQTDDSAGLRNLVWALIQIALAIGFAWRLHRNLEQRRFALERKPV